MKRKITFSTSDDQNLSISLDNNQISFEIGYYSAGPFSKDEAWDIKDALEQILDCIKNS